MKTQRSRHTFDATNRYSGVFQQQGRMLTDADWNEASHLTKERLDDVLRDVIGSGTPRERGFIEETIAPDGTRSYRLRWGYAYVDGIVGQVRPDLDALLADPTSEDFEYAHQADLPLPPALPATPVKLYLDVWERTVTYLEDPALRDAALHGADTCTRTQTMCQVKACDPALDPADATANPPIGGALLTLSLREGSTDPDPCDPCAEEMNLNVKVGNYLFRLEVHDVVHDAAGAPVEVTLKWSAENGAEQYAADEVPIGFANSGYVFEFFSGPDTGMASEKHLGLHHSVEAGWKPTRGELHHLWPDALPTDRPLVRRWDGAAVFAKDGSDWTLVVTEDASDRGVPLSTTSSADAPGHVDEGPVLGLHLSALDLELELADEPVLAGDFWETPVRAATDEAGDVLLEDAPPSGILHHYMVLGLLDGEIFTPESDEVCRRFAFPPLTDLRALDVCYDNKACAMPGVTNVKEALDFLCRQKDLKWHNKHLHGWGVVCGLQVNCAPRKLNGTEEDEAARQRQIRVRSGYALDCEGNDIVLPATRPVPLLDLIDRLEERGETPILTDGNGTVALSIEVNPLTGGPRFEVEKYDPKKGDLSALFKKTLLFEFYEDCIKKLLDQLKSEVDFSDVTDPNADGLEARVPERRRLLVSLLHLVLQFVFNQHGRYIFLAHQRDGVPQGKGHELLKGFYDRLRELLRSQTFCAMYEEDEFPEYPFRDSAMSTAFGKNGHTRILLHPSGDFVYTYGGANKLINIFETKSEELVAVHEMPSGQGAEIRALTFSPDGRTLYAAASLREEDCIYGFADVEGAKLRWRGTVMLCDLDVRELIHAEGDEGLVYATGRGDGLYALHRDTLFDLEKQTLDPIYAFNAVGHLRIDFETQRAFATAREDGEPTGYDQVVILDLQKQPDPASGQVSLSPTGVMTLRQGDIRLHGEDGFCLGRTDADGLQLLHVVTEHPSDKSAKLLVTCAVNGFQGGSNIFLPIENGPAYPHYDARANRVVLALAASFRLQAVSPDGRRIVVERIPVQVHPIAIASGAKNENLYTLNFLSNTVSITPLQELNVSDEFNQALATYRMEVILAFVALLGGVFQYLKDCFCQHLLVNCPSCEEDDKVYLAVIEIRNREVYKICNFAMRKDVHTIPKLEHWLSLIPIMPILKKGVEKVCCMVLPDVLEKYASALAERITDAPVDPTKSATIAYPAKRVERGSLAYQRTDLKGEYTDLKKRGGVVLKLGSDVAITRAEAASPAKSGLRKSALLNNDLNTARKQMAERGIEVAEVKTYDPKDAGQLKAFRETPSRIPKGSQVEVYTNNEGKVLFYTLKQSTPAFEFTGVSESTKAELSALERRKAAIADNAEIRAELQTLESERTAARTRVDKLKSELATLETERAALADNQALRTQLDGLKGEIASLKTERAALADTSDLRTQLDSMRTEIATLRAERANLADTATIRTEITSLKAEYDALKTARETEAERLTALKRQRDAAASEVAKLSTDLESILQKQRDAVVVINRERPITEVEGITPDLQTHLTGLGVRTVGELAAANPQALVRRGVLTQTDATKLIKAARTRLG